MVLKIFNDKKITVCPGITSIADRVFYGCANLSTVTIPESVTKIGDSAFSGCSNISAAYYPGTEEQWAKVRVGYYNENLINNIVFESDSERPYYGFGTCGENLTWEFDESTGTLTISGAGEMYDYSYYNRPWESYKDNILSLLDPNDENYAFNYNLLKNSLISAALPQVMGPSGHL